MVEVIMKKRGMAARDWPEEGGDTGYGGGGGLLGIKREKLESERGFCDGG